MSVKQYRYTNLIGWLSSRMSTKNTNRKKENKPVTKQYTGSITYQHIKSAINGYHPQQHTYIAKTALVWSEKEWLVNNCNIIRLVRKFTFKSWGK